MEKQNIKFIIKEKGITIIVLVITIIVMLILAGISINITLDGGLVNGAKEARNQTEQEKFFIEISSLAKYDSKRKYINILKTAEAIEEEFAGNVTIIPKIKDEEDTEEDEVIDEYTDEVSVTVLGKYGTYCYKYNKNEVIIDTNLKNLKAELEGKSFMEVGNYEGDIGNISEPSPGDIIFKNGEITADIILYETGSIIVSYCNEFYIVEIEGTDLQNIKISQVNPYYDSDKNYLKEFFSENIEEIATIALQNVIEIVYTDFSSVIGGENIEYYAWDQDNSEEKLRIVIWYQGKYYIVKYEFSGESMLLTDVYFVGYSNPIGVSYYNPSKKVYVSNSWILSNTNYQAQGKEYTTGIKTKGIYKIEDMFPISLYVNGKRLDISVNTSVNTGVSLSVDGTALSGRYLSKSDQTYDLTGFDYGYRINNQEEVEIIIKNLMSDNKVFEFKFKRISDSEGEITIENLKYDVEIDCNVANN